MNKLTIAIYSVILACMISACSDTSESKGTELENAISSESKSTELENAISSLNNGGDTSKISQERLDEAKALIERAKNGNYTLVTNDWLENEIANNNVIVIAAIPQGIYNLGLISGARNFEFAKSFSLNNDGTEWNWEKDAFGVSKERFLELLESNKDKQIVFYDNGNDIFSPMGSAHVGILWAKKLGYNNVFRLIGGFEGWKNADKLISFEIPECCVNPQEKSNNPLKIESK